jgi:predicted DCC family thiol-disulfide oxidoreductase YuxK
MTSQLLIYDGECAYCRGFVALVQLMDRRKRISVIPFDDPDSQALLNAQFGERYGFAMYLFEPKEVSWGAEAARRIVESLSFPRWMARLACYVYPALVPLVSRLTRRTRPVCGPECAGLPSRRSKQQFVQIQPDALQLMPSVLKSQTS